MIPSAIWRVEALALPLLARRCARCSCAGLVPTGRFRVNAQKKRLDVWLLYRCPACDAPARQRVHRRVAVAAIGDALERFLRDDPALVRACAFALPPAAPVAYRLLHPPLPDRGRLRIRIEQPEPCGVRWDRLLSEALGSRAVLRRAWRAGRIALPGVRSLARVVRDGQELEIQLGEPDSTPPRDRSIGAAIP